MHFEPNYFTRASVEAPLAQYERCGAELRAAFERDWLEPESAPPLQVPLGALVPVRSPLPRRRWAVTPSTMQRLGLGVRRVQRLDDAAQNSDTATFESRHREFMQKIELLLLEVAARLSPWGALTPASVEWLVSSAGPPTVLDLGLAAKTAEYSLEEALDEHEFKLEFPLVPDMPADWSRRLRDAVRWELAAGMDLTISKNYGPPPAIVGKHFAELPNPFLYLCNLWRSGVVLSTSFDAEPAVLAVNARRV
jgi:hypothetical protein